ncbi:MAG TPA: hypothetical protein VJ965_02305 [Anaerolineales bacterium]|nr:hypothetical protein [Anaerolineales bacterium]
MKDKFRSVLGILAIGCLIAGAWILVSNFSIRLHVMLDTEFLTPQKWLLGFLAVGLIVTGIGIFSWLRRDRYLKSDSNPQSLSKKTPFAMKVRQDANYKGYFLLTVVGMIVLAILYYAYFG